MKRHAERDHLSACLNTYTGEEVAPPPLMSELLVIVVNPTVAVGIARLAGGGIINDGARWHLVRGPVIARPKSPTGFARASIAISTRLSSHFCFLSVMRYRIAAWEDARPTRF